MRKFTVLLREAKSVKACKILFLLRWCEKMQYLIQTLYRKFKYSSECVTASSANFNLNRERKKKEKENSSLKYCRKLNFLIRKSEFMLNFLWLKFHEILYTRLKTFINIA